MSASAQPRRGNYQKHRLIRILVTAVTGLGLLLLTVVLGQHEAGALASGTKDISAKALTSHDDCNDTEWHFVINQVDSEVNAPATIHVTWANGNSADVPLGEFKKGGVAHYTTTANLTSTVTSATAVIYDSWPGEFNLSHGPCGPSTPPSTSPPPSPSTVRSTPPSNPSTATTPPSTPSTATTPPSASTTVRTTTPGSSASTPATATSSTTSQAAAATTSSPFVPGPGQTGDLPPSDGFPLRQLLLGLATALLAAAGVMSMNVLRRRGNHS